ncbi:MAG: ComF family protein [Candidatus Gastranaerophilales bacterium]|nr:ComF family protein [Candidatus Gastranaerophilales bacterium]
MVWNFKNKISYLYNSFLDLIYTQKCIVCSCAKTNNFLCKTCAKDVEYLSCFAHRIYKGIPIYSMAKYNNVIKNLIHLLKFKHNKKAAKVLSYLFFEYYKKLNLNKDFIIVYPPSFYLKNLSRGYNHMFLITKEFCKLSNLDYKKDLIKKIKPTKPQYKAKNRHKNIENSFDINKKLIEKYKNKNILLIDDITTSGATLEEIVNCLLSYGFKNITCLTISKA